MKSKKVVRWLIRSAHLPSKQQRLIGIYATREEAEFILSKIKHSTQRTGYQYTVEETDKPLHPATSNKVGKHLSTLSRNQP